MEDRLIDLETRFSFQEVTIETLSDLIASQQSQIDALTRRIDGLTLLFERLLEGRDPPIDFAV